MTSLPMPKSERGPHVPFFFETNPPASAFNSSSPFLRLPAELRIKIYEILFSCSRITFWEIDAFSDDSITTEVVYACGPTFLDVPPTGPPIWPLTSKLILSEALSVFYRHARHVGHVGSTTIGGIQPTPFRLYSIFRMRNFDLSDRRREVRLVFSDTARRLDNKIVAYLLPERSWFDNDILHICEHFRRHTHHMKELKLRLRFDDPHKNPQQKLNSQVDWNPNLSAFTALGPTLERVEFTISAPEVYGKGQAQLEIIYRTYLMLQVKLEELGKYLIGVKEDDQVGWRAKGCHHQGNAVMEWSIKIWRTEGRQARRQVQGGLRSFIDWGGPIPKGRVAVMEATSGSITSQALVNHEPEEGEDEVLQTLEVGGIVFLERPRSSRVGQYVLG